MQRRVFPAVSSMHFADGKALACGAGTLNLGGSVKC